MSFSDYMEDVILAHAWGNQPYTAPGTIYTALSTTPPNDNGTNVTEPVGNGYARVGLVNNGTNWITGGTGQRQNGVEILYPTPTGPWGTVTHFVNYDALTGGNMMGHGVLGASKTIDTDDTVRFQPNQLVITLD